MWGRGGCVHVSPRVARSVRTAYHRPVPTNPEPVFRPNTSFHVNQWLWLVNALLESADTWARDPWSPFAQMWRRRAEALLAASPDAAPYLKEWRASPARKHEGDPPPDPMDQPVELRLAVTTMLRDAERDLSGDLEILRRAHDHVRAFADPQAPIHVADLPDVRESEWDPTQFVLTGRKAKRVPIQDLRQSSFEDAERRERRPTDQSRKPEEQPHVLFRPIGSFFGRQPVQEPDTKVFVVHGRDHGPRDAVCVVLMTLGLDPVVLEDEVNQGRTLIEKFERYSDVSYAVVIMTPEDEVTATDGTREKRPRQNVVLEFGYLMGALGRDRVAVMQVEQLTAPSDVNGIAYIPLDANGGWKLRLANELKAAGLEVSIDRLR
jgi:CAP12/Pycsar effector protein, TIR domain